MKHRNTFTKLWALADNYMHMSSRVKNIKRDYHFSVRKNRSLDHLNRDERKVPVSLSFTLGNLIVDQKIGKII